MNKVMCISEIKISYTNSCPEVGEICTPATVRHCSENFFIPKKGRSGYYYILEGYDSNIGYSVECFAELSGIDGVEILNYECKKQLV